MGKSTLKLLLIPLKQAYFRDLVKIVPLHEFDERIYVHLVANILGSLKIVYGSWYWEINKPSCTITYYYKFAAQVLCYIINIDQKISTKGFSNFLRMRTHFCSLCFWNDNFYLPSKEGVKKGYSWIQQSQTEH